MKTRIFWVAMALMVFASLSFGTEGCWQLYNDDHPLLQTASDGTCTGAPWPDGTPLYIYWDNDSNGPDADDPLADVGIGPGQVNYNTFALNGESELGVPGTFVTDVDFCCIAGLPSTARFYIVLRCPEGTWNWVSEVATLTFGLTDFDFNTWTCTPCAVPCQQPLVVQILWHGFIYQEISVCLSLCEGQTTVIRSCRADGEPFEPYFLPIIFWHPGCGFDCESFDPNCIPGDAIVTDPFYDPNGGCWEVVVIGLVDNTCVCFTEVWMAADIDRESFIAVPGDHRVDLSWRTLAEREVSHFVVVRNGETVTHVPAENNIAGAAYHYTDDAVVNGTTYTYTLRVVNTDNTVDETGLEVQATPSSNAAGMITEYALHQNYPNPFNPETQITFDLMEGGLVSLKIFNLMGQQVAEPVNGTESAGRHTISFNAADLPSGMYLYKLDVNRFSATEKMVLLK